MAAVHLAAPAGTIPSDRYLTRVRNGDAEEDTDLRVLKTLKANYAAIGNEIRIRWHNGVFKLASDSASPATAAAEARAEQTFLDMLDAYTVQKRTVSASPSANFAPTVFAADRSCTVTKRGLIDAMNRLLTAGKVSVEEFGPPSKRRSRLVRTPE
jgi:RecA-family ATPase